jgi:hypothetical protein
MTVSEFTGRRLRAALTGAALPLSSAVALITAPFGRRAAEPPPAGPLPGGPLPGGPLPGGRRAAGGGAGRVAATRRAVVGLVLGALAIVPLGVLVLFVARGVLYGIVVDGPYDTSWGGPTRAGAWAAHFLVGVPLAGLALFALSGLAGLHGRWSRLIDGERGNRWVVPVTGLIVAAAGLLVWAWTRQL